MQGQQRQVGEPRPPAQLFSAPAQRRAQISTDLVIDADHVANPHVSNLYLIKNNNAVSRIDVHQAG